MALYCKEVHQFKIQWLDSSLFLFFDTVSSLGFQDTFLVFLLLHQSSSSVSLTDFSSSGLLNVRMTQYCPLSSFFPYLYLSLSTLNSFGNLIQADGLKDHLHSNTRIYIFISDFFPKFQTFISNYLFYNSTWTFSRYLKLIMLNN